MNNKRNYPNWFRPLRGGNNSAIEINKKFHALVSKIEDLDGEIKSLKGEDIQVDTGKVEAQEIDFNDIKNHDQADQFVKSNKLDYSVKKSKKIENVLEDIKTLL